MEAPRFVSDLYLPRMLHAITIRSPVARGRLARVESPALPEGRYLLAAGDVPGENSLGDWGPPILAGGELSYVGEPVALLLGPDMGELERLAALCAVVAEEGEPVLSLREAAARARAGGGGAAAEREIVAGDPDAAFASAASVVRGEYETGVQEHWYPEPCCAAAWFELPGEGEPGDSGGAPRGGEARGPRLAVGAATQWPSHVRQSVARALGVGDAGVAVRPFAAGPHLDGKFWYPSLVACHAALGAWVTGRPVRLALSRREDFSFSPKRFAASVSVASALDEKGDLAGAEIEVAINVGAGGPGAQEMLDQACLGSLGLYAAKNVRVRGLALRTNIPPQGPFAGFGLAQGLFAAERHASLVADGLGRDPAQWRRDNLARAGSLPPGLPIRDEVPAARLLDAAAGMSDYARKRAAYELLRRRRGEPAHQDDAARACGEALRGIGIALGYQAGGLLHPSLHGAADGGGYGVELILEKDGSLEIKAGMAGAGRGAVWADIAEAILGVEAGSVRVSSAPESSLEPGPETMSRKTTALADLVEQACLAIRGLRFRDPLPISVNETAGPAEDPEWGRLFSLPAGGAPPGGGRGPDCSGFLRPGSAAAVVEVEISPSDRVPRVRGAWLAVDGGRIFREGEARASLKLAAAQALGWAFRERVEYSAGGACGGCFEGFDIPGSADVPPVSVGFLDGPSREPKGIGDLPFACVPAAYLQAVSQAADRRFASLPLRSGDLWRDGAAGRQEGQER